jgi:hypothetical protein
MIRTRIALPIALAGLALLLLLGPAGHATGGEDALAPLPGSLDELLAGALRQNPEILVEEARVREAQARLNQTRLAVTQRVVQLHFERIEMRRVLGGQAESHTRLRQLYEAGSTSDSDLRDAEIALAQTEGDIARIDAELRYAIGHGSALADSGLLAEPRSTAVPVDEDEVPRPPVPAEIAKVLDTAMIAIDFQETPIEEVVGFLADTAGIEIQISPGLRDQGLAVTMRMRGQVPLRKAIHALADQTEVGFAVREYGLLALWLHDLPDGVAVIPPVEP